jgi:hypothetical protein
MEFPLSEGDNLSNVSTEFPMEQPKEPIQLDAIAIRANGLGHFNTLSDQFLAKFFLIPFWAE